MDFRNSSVLTQGWMPTAGMGLKCKIHMLYAKVEVNVLQMAQEGLQGLQILIQLLIILFLFQTNRQNKPIRGGSG